MATTGWFTASSLGVSILDSSRRNEADESSPGCALPSVRPACAPAPEAPPAALVARLDRWPRVGRVRGHDRNQLERAEPTLVREKRVGGEAVSLSASSREPAVHGEGDENEGRAAMPAPCAGVMSVRATDL